MYLVILCRKSVHTVSSLIFSSLMLFKTSELLCLASVGDAAQWLSLLFSSTMSWNQSSEDPASINA